MTEIVYLLNPDAKILKDNHWVLPACYVTGNIKIEGKSYNSAIFLCLEGIQDLLADFDSLEECLQKLVEHETVHELIEWEHEFEGKQK